MPFICLLSSVTDDPRFDGLSPIDDSSLLGHEDLYEDFVVLEADRRNWKVPRLAKLWTPRKVKGRMSPEIDYPTVAGIPAFSQRAVDILGDLLKRNGEILPLITDDKLGKYYAYNTTTVADVLDLKRCEIDSMDDSFSVSFILHYEFIASKLKGLSIFRIPEDTSQIYVTDTFVSRVLEHDLQGFELKKVWPLPVGTNWFVQPAMGRDKNTAAKPTSAKPRSTKASQVTAQPPTGDEAQSLSEAIRDCETHIGFAASSMPVADAHARIDQALTKLRESKLPKNTKVDRAFWLAIAWGEATVRGLRWEWVMLQDQAGRNAIAVASPDRAYAVPVVGYVERQALGKAAELTSHLLYNMIKTRQMTPAKAGALKILG